MTIGRLWERSASRDPEGRAFLVQDGEGWRTVTWKEASERVDELAAGFLALGIGKGDPVAILSRTRIEWTLCDYALASIGAVVVPIYQTNSRDECAYLLSDSRARLLVCENEEQLQKVEGLVRDLPDLERVVAIDDAQGDVMALSEVAAHGRDHHSLAEARDAVSESDVLTYIYT
ncbi:MAG TPA: AMP-binding protein, partial [Gaiellaceae bacterium]|nr:AMP-binding protein [Gaiellaceae bacterium]